MINTMDEDTMVLILNNIEHLDNIKTRADKEETTYNDACHGLADIHRSERTEGKEDIAELVGLVVVPTYLTESPN